MLFRKKFNIKTDAMLSIEVHEGDVKIEVRGQGKLLIEALAAALTQSKEFSDLLEEAVKLHTASVVEQAIEKQKPILTYSRKVVN